jgi:hypothetical protein
VLPPDTAIAAIKSAIQETYGKRGEALERNAGRLRVELKRILAFLSVSIGMPPY